jgi:hypothetical protein
VALLLPVKVFEKFTGAPGLVPIRSAVVVCADGELTTPEAIAETLNM